MDHEEVGGTHCGCLGKRSKNTHTYTYRCNYSGCCLGSLCKLSSFEGILTDGAYRRVFVLTRVSILYLASWAASILVITVLVITSFCFFENTVWTFLADRRRFWTCESKLNLALLRTPISVVGIFIVTSLVSFDHPVPADRGTYRITVDVNFTFKSIFCLAISATAISRTGIVVITGFGSSFDPIATLNFNRASTWASVSIYIVCIITLFAWVKNPVSTGIYTNLILNYEGSWTSWADSS